MEGYSDVFRGESKILSCIVWRCSCITLGSLIEFFSPTALLFQQPTTPHPRSLSFGILWS